MTLRQIIVADPSEDEDPGVEGNTRLTASLGIVLTGLLLVEGFTILDVRGYITLHTFLGLLLIGPVLAKTATTTYRFSRYYTHKAPYVRRGPPPIVLRLIGPLVVLSTFAVLGTGVALLATHGSNDTWLTLHQASFIVWIAVTGVHFLAHLVEAVRGTARDLRTGGAPRGRTVRILTVAAAFVVGVAIAGAFTPTASSWQLHHGDHGRFDH